MYTYNKLLCENLAQLVHLFVFYKKQEIYVKLALLKYLACGEPATVYPSQYSCSYFLTKPYSIKLGINQCICFVFKIKTQSSGQAGVAEVPGTGEPATVYPSQFYS